MKAEILAVGTELLLGDIVNTNAQFLAQELAALGISVYFQTVVGDNSDRLMEAYKIAFSRADLVITSGGLGPTEDDLTKETAAKYFNKKLIRDEESLKHMEDYLLSQNFTVTENNKKQADIPEGATILKNYNGTAPGICIKENEKTLILLPGPPVELIPMFKKSVLPILAENQELLFYSKTLKIFGIGESALETKLRDLINVQTNPTIATYANISELKLRLTASASNPKEASEIIKPVADEIYKRIGEDIYGEDDETLASALAKKLLEKGLKLAVAESCTGGKLSSMLVEYSGISETLLESIVTYSNESKIQRLGVKAETLEQYGAVSEQTAIEMARGVVQSLNADIGISTTGVAGPSGGTDEKPVGLVYIGLYIQGKEYFKKCMFKGNRERIRTRAAITALDFALRNLK